MVNFLTLPIFGHRQGTGRIKYFSVMGHVLALVFPKKELFENPENTLGYVSGKEFIQTQLYS